MMRFSQGKFLDVPVEVLADVQALRHRIRHQDVAQSLAEGHGHIGAAPLFLVLDSGDAVDFSDLVDDLVVEGAHVKGQEQFARVNQLEHGQQVVVGFVQGFADERILVEGVFDDRFDVLKQDDRRFHIYDVQRMLAALRRDVDEALQLEGVDDFGVVARFVYRTVHGVGKVAGNELRQNFRNGNLGHVVDSRRIVGVEEADAGDAAAGGVGG